MRILVVEDERKVNQFIVQALTEAGLITDAVSDVSDMLTGLQTTAYDVIILDRLLRGEDSLDHMGEIRALAPKAKIIVLSALSEIDDKVRGLSDGADDYMGKPFHVKELVARIRALTRRHESLERTTRDTIVDYDDLKIDLTTQRVTRGTKRIDLTSKEFKTLVILARHPGQIFSKTQILDEVWDLNHFPESNVVEVTIANLRSKVDRGQRPLIHSRRGVGYWLGEP